MKGNRRRVNLCIMREPRVVFNNYRWTKYENLRKKLKPLLRVLKGTARIRAVNWTSDLRDIAKRKKFYAGWREREREELRGSRVHFMKLHRV